MSWFSGFRHVPLAQFRSWSRKAREVPHPCKESRFPTRPLPGPSKKGATPRPSSSGTPVYPPLPKETEKAGNRTGKPGRSAAARGPLPGPDLQREAPGPGRDSPAFAFRGNCGPGPEAEEAEAEGASAVQPEGLAQGRGRETRAVLAASAPHSRHHHPRVHPCACPPQRRPLAPHGHPRPTAPTRRKWRAPGAAPLHGRRAAALEPDQSGIERRAGARRAGPHLTAPASPAPS